MLLCRTDGSADPLLQYATTMTSVLHVITDLGMGGAEGMLVRLAKATEKQNVRQHVVSLRSRGIHGEELEAAGIGMTALGVKSTLNVPVGLLKLRRCVRQVRPTIIQGWMYHGNLFAALAHRLTPGSGNQSLFWNLRASNMDEARYGSLLRLTARLSTWPDIVIANSESGAQIHRDRGYRPRRMVIIDNGIDTERFQPDEKARLDVRRELAIPSDVPLAIHVARVDPMKDHDTFLLAMAKLPSVTALMVGSGTERLRTPPNVVGLGLRGDVERLYAAADFVVSSSAFGEGSSNIIAEGMSVGLVPIATDVGDAKRIVGDTGYVVQPRNADALAASLLDACGLGEVRATRGLRARARILEKFTIHRCLDAYLDLYREATHQE
jgi:glycosyltransferase involved in cell wall biosynthesis